MPRVETKSPTNTLQENIETKLQKSSSYHSFELQSLRRKFECFSNFKEKVSTALFKIKDSVIKPQFLSSMGFLLFSIGINSTNADALDSKLKPETNNKIRTELIQTIKVDKQGNISLREIASKYNLSKKMTGSDEDINAKYANGTFKIIDGKNGKEVRVNISQLKKNPDVKSELSIIKLKKTLEGGDKSVKETSTKNIKSEVNQTPNIKRSIEIKTATNPNKFTKPLVKFTPPSSVSTIQPQPINSTPEVESLLPELYEDEDQNNFWESVWDDLSVSVGALSAVGAGIAGWMNKKKIVQSAKNLAFNWKRMPVKNVKKFKEQEKVTEMGPEMELKEKKIDDLPEKAKVYHTNISQKCLELKKLFNLSFVRYDYEVLSGNPYASVEKPNIQQLEVEKNKLKGIVRILDSAITDLSIYIGLENDYRYALAGIEEFDRIFDYLSPLFICHDRISLKDTDYKMRIEKLRNYIYQTVHKSKINPLYAVAESDFELSKNNYFLDIISKKESNYVSLVIQTYNSVDNPRSLAQEIIDIAKQVDMRIDVEKLESGNKEMNKVNGELRSRTCIVSIYGYSFKVNKKDYILENMQKFRVALIRNRRNKLKKLITETRMNFSHHITPVTDNLGQLLEFMSDDNSNKQKSDPFKEIVSSGKISAALKIMKANNLSFPDTLAFLQRNTEYSRFVPALTSYDSFLEAFKKSYNNHVSN